MPLPQQLARTSTPYDHPIAPWNRYQHMHEALNSARCHPFIHRSDMARTLFTPTRRFSSTLLRKTTHSERHLCDRFGPECDKYTLTTIGNLYNWIYPECSRQNQYHSDRSESIRSTPTIVLLPWYVHTWLELHIKSLSNFGSAVTVSPIGRRLQLFITLHTGHKCTYTWHEPPTLMSGQWVFLHIINHIQL